MPDAPRVPSRDEIEFSAFGPGYGECLLVHLGEQEWMIVDSCAEPHGVQPALAYLESLQVDAARQVKLVVATHWHDDHIRGMADVVAACPDADFSCSVALSPREIVQGIGGHDDSRFAPFTSGVTEFRRVFELLTDGGRGANAMWAVDRRPLYTRDGSVGCRVVALSPSNKMVQRAHEDVAKVIAQGATGRVPAPNLNLGAVVLWVEVGDATLLLGADLPQVPGSGWTPVLACQVGTNRKAEIFKIPHHGSAGAHHPPVWDQMCVTRPHAVVCPHYRGRTQLPMPADLHRLCGLAEVHLTAAGRPAAVMRNGRLMRPSRAPMGRVTLRRAHGAGSTWAVDYVNGAQNGCPPPAGVHPVPPTP